MATSALNPNFQWAAVLVQELAACGLRAVCIAPGSRSTPLTLAFARHPEIELYLHLDERSAGFAALGMALATNLPVALVCTSGTAAAEFLPAVIEARHSQIPLLVLTADRPPELRQSGANQTIDQVKLYGDQVLWFMDVAVPEASAPPIALANLRTLAARAFALANGIVKGAVHLNFPFRKPLEPTTPAEMNVNPLAQPTVRFEAGRLLPTEEQLATLAAACNAAQRGVIVCGPRCADGDFPAEVAALAQRLGWPILADALSGVRYGAQVSAATVVSTYESLLNPMGQGWEKPEIILRFGAVPTSKWLNEYLSASDATAVIHVRSSGVWADDTHRVTHFLQADEAATCVGLAARITRRADGWAARWAAAEAQACAVTRRYCAGQPFDAAYVAALFELLPAEANLFAGNSLPIRHVDQFGASRSAPLHVYANRGASGIDGTTSTALAIAAAQPERPLLFLTGDVAFYHDMNGLLALRQQALRNVTIVLLNNNGGGIFRRLPVSRLDPLFTELFITPHDLDFAHVAALYDLRHIHCQSIEQFRQALTHALTQPQTHLLEITTDSAGDLERQRALVRQIKQVNN